MSDGRAQEAGVERIHAEPVGHDDAAAGLPVGEADVRLVIVVGEDEIAAGEIAHDVAAQLVLGRRGDFTDRSEVERLVRRASGGDRGERHCNREDQRPASASHVRYLAYSAGMRPPSVHFIGSETSRSTGIFTGLPSGRLNSRLPMYCTMVGRIFPAPVYCVRVVMKTVSCLTSELPASIIHSPGASD